MNNVPDRIGRYTVAERLGEGGMGEVYLAYSPAGSPVAVKVIRRDRLGPDTRARFEREALIARTVIGTNRVARFLDADPYADRPWLVMEYVPGRTLLQHVDEHGGLPFTLVASLGALLAEGLEAVHAVNLLHRDLKPQNIIMGTDGPIIIDFGLSAFVGASHDSLSHPGTLIGTLRCMPPEQAEGNPRVTAAADVYALGTVLLYAVAGHYAYDGQWLETIRDQVINPQVAPDLSGVPAELLPLLRDMLGHTPQDRPGVREVGEACAALLTAVGVTPMHARLELIARTTPGSSATRAWNQVPSPAVEARLAPEAPPESPLDTPREPAEVATSEANAKESESSATRRASRPAASQRVAEELRTAYAASSSL